MEVERTPRTDLQRLWYRLTKSDQEILAYFSFAPPPVSVDTLASLSGTSAVAVLSVMEHLRKRGIVREKKEVGKGFYFPRDSSFTDFVRRLSESCPGIGPKIIRHHISTYPDGEEKTIVLAGLYRKLGSPLEGLDVVKQAADILRRSNKKTEAGELYDHVINSLSKHVATPDQGRLFVDCVVEKTDLMMHRIPVRDQVTLLSRAESIAREEEMWDRLARIELWLARALQDTGRSKQAARHVNEFLSFSKMIVDKTKLKATSHWMAEYFVWKGRFDEAIRCYEEMVGDLEEFGDNEMLLRSTCIVGLAYAINGRVSRGLGMIDAVRGKSELLGLPDVINYCDHATICVLLELRKIPEAEVCVKRMSALPEGILGPFLSWALSDQKAYVLCRKQAYEEAIACLKNKAELSKAMGRIHSPFSWTFETLSILESQGFGDGSLIDLDSFVKSMFDWDDVSTKGIALRYRALRNAERRHSAGTILADLEESERCLRRSGDFFQLARTRFAQGKYYLAMGETKLGRQCLSRARESLSTLDENLTPEDLLDLIPGEQKVKHLVQRMTRINESLGTIGDTSSFLDRVLNVAMDFTGAMRGAFVADDGGGLRIIASRNVDAALLHTEKFRRVRELIVASTKGGAQIISPSAKSAGNRPDNTAFADPLICMPARLGEELVGHLCLDGRFDNEPFPENLVPFVEMLCSQIAVGLNNIKTWEELRKQVDRVEEEAVFYKREMGMTSPLSAIIGTSKGIRSVKDQICQVAVTNSSVLVLGETGVGKELVAKAIHSLSSRKDGPFIPLNLATLPRDLVASELFGHEKGAFTGATERKKGRFELADGGTIFLDEIGDLPLDAQVKLLRVLQEGSFERLGDAKPICSDFRVIAATNKNLPVEVEKGRFRQDLYFRLNVFPIYVPPLRERRDDIPPLVQEFVTKFAAKNNRSPKSINQREIKGLLEYNWPGNVRELEHFVERAVILSGGPIVRFPTVKPPWEAIPEYSLMTSLEGENARTKSLSDVERDHIVSVLDSTDWVIAGPNGAAVLLGLCVSTLRFRMAKLNITKPPRKASF